MPTAIALTWIPDLRWSLFYIKMNYWQLRRAYTYSELIVKPVNTILNT
jgi:hypothetical protein